MDTKGWYKRDALVSSEQSIQKMWANKQSTSCAELDKRKCFVTFPYPYMNGTLHLGHAYTISKAEFYSRYRIICGDNVMFPFAFHGTGMPIVACAKKLKQELETVDIKNIDINKLEDNNQIKILSKMDISFDEMKNFIDPYYWLKYFPKRAEEDLKLFGVCADFTRSFITTDMNPYYDSFVKWQFNKLNSKNRLIFGKKPVIYSILDGQPCADHDRSIGEGVGVKEFILLKMKIINTDMRLLVATTRPETIIGITNLWINKNIIYSVKMYDNIKYIARPETFRNLEYQYTDKKFTDVGVISGLELLRFNVEFEGKYISLYHYETDPEIGSGIVASVPSVNIIDYKAYMKLTDKLEIKDIMTVNNKPISCELVDKIKKSKSIVEISKEIYRLEQESGLMITGPYIGKTPTEANILTKKDMISREIAWLYYEPEEKVISRSGDRCIVALTDQWFINYGDPIWKEDTINYCKNTLNTYNSQAKNMLLSGVNWLHEWPCSRSYGLGTQLLDTSYVIDSLSDSTIYPAYYTIAHKIEQLPKYLLIDTVWDYIFLDKDFPESCNDFKELLEELRNEFKYWYPVDLRVSGKDLLTNHLAMAIYNHINIWDSTMCPNNYSANGHLLINTQKMSKHTGNFMTLKDAVKKYGADATRIALAEAGSNIEDANFEDTNADNAVLRLTIEKEWCESMIKYISIENKDNIDEITPNIWDTIFENEIKMCAIKAKKHYEELDFQKVIVTGFYDLMIARDKYRYKVDNGLFNMNKKIIKMFLEIHLSIIYPICPHYATYLQNYAIDHKIDIQIRFPTFTDIDMKYIWIRNGIDEYVSKCRSKLGNFKKKNKKIEVSKANITIYSGYNSETIIMFKQICNDLEKGIDRKEIFKKYTINDDNKSKKNKFLNDIINDINTYGNNIIDWLQSDIEYIIITEWLPKILTEFKGVKFEFINEPNGHWNPKIEYS